MLITVTVNHRHNIYQKHTVQGLWNIINLNYHFEHNSFHKLLLQTNVRSTLFYSLSHKRNLRYLAKAKTWWKQCYMINQRKSSLNDTYSNHFLACINIWMHWSLCNLIYVTYKNVSVTKIRLDMFSQQW